MLFARLLMATMVIQPDFGPAGLDILARTALPFALGTVGTAVVVIAGGIKLSIAAMMAVASVTAAMLMDGPSDGGSDGHAPVPVLAVPVLGGWGAGGAGHWSKETKSSIKPTALK